MGRPAQAGRPFVRYNGCVGETRLQLDRADSAPALPRLGGMARPDGVVIVSERHWAFSGSDGTLLEGRMPELPAVVRRVPLLRGLAKLVLAFAPVMGRSGPTKRLERAGLLAALFLPFGL